MNQDYKENIQIIINKIQPKQIVELLYNFFEISETPEIVALNRGKTSLKGYILIKKKIFEFAIIFLKQNDKLEIVVDLYFGKHALVKTKEISIETNEQEINVFLNENKQYLFSIYF